MTFLSTRRLLIASAAAFALSTSLGAQAQSASPASATPVAPAQAAASLAPRGAQLDIRQVFKRMQDAGMHSISEIDWDDGRYEVKATNAQGQRVKLYVNGTTGAIEYTRIVNRHR
ncbi:PepSY domain-containing protein [Castellaniella caeni]|uniref:PepSY domain-containing protein n=1 Tax=Castellaniella caeni TaxID=266123 RepID=UPI000836399E|nr:PepSY domain-containing protein [Castellaniella caeni]